MARLNLDEIARSDKRITNLASDRKEPRQYTMGRLIDVWWCCYQQRSIELDIVDVDEAAEADGFAMQMVARRLAVLTGSERVRVAGAEDRIGYLLGLSKLASAGGDARAKTARRGPSGRFESSMSPADDQPSSSHTAGDLQPSASQSPAPSSPLPLPPDLPLPLPPDPAPAQPPDLGEARAEPIRKPRRRSPELPLPDTWEPTVAHVDQARALQLDIATEARRFRMHAQTHDRRCVRWNAAFSNWLEGSASRRRAAPTQSGPRGADAVREVLKDHGDLR